MLKITTTDREFYIKEKAKLFVLNKSKKLSAKKLKSNDFIFDRERVKKIEKSNFKEIEDADGVQTNTIKDFVKELDLNSKSFSWTSEKSKKLMNKYNIIRVEFFMVGVLITNAFLDRLYVSGEFLEEDFIENILTEINLQGIKFLRNGTFEFFSEEPKN